MKRFGTIVEHNPKSMTWNVETIDGESMWLSGWSFGPEYRSRLKVGLTVEVTYAIGRYFVKIVEE